MTTSKKPDFQTANEKANEVLLLSKNISSFPFKAKRLIEEWTDIKCVKFIVAEEKYNVDIRAFGSDSAVLHALNGRHVLFYNQNEIDTRIRFSIMHEFGHYYLKHPLKRENEDEYDIFEVEANTFAAQLLMPEQIIRELMSRGISINAKKIMEYFGVSKEGAEKRMETMGKYNYEWRNKKEKEFDDCILLKYSQFVDGIIPKRNFYNWYEDDYERQKERDSWGSGTRRNSGY